jgi:hypothetical protein
MQPYLVRRHLHLHCESLPGGVFQLSRRGSSVVSGMHGVVRVAGTHDENVRIDPRVKSI